MHGPSHVCQMKRYVFTCFNFLGNCCSTLEPNTKWERKTPKPKSKCLVLVLGALSTLCLSSLWIDEDDEGERGESLLQTYFSLLRVLFLSEMLNLLTAVVSYLIYFICGIYLSVAFLSAFLTLLEFNFWLFCLVIGT